MHLFFPTPIWISEIINYEDINKELIKFIYEVTGLIEKRVSAKIACENLKDLTSQEEKFKMKAASAQPIAKRDKGMGRPTKKDRRNIEKLKWGK